MNRLRLLPALPLSGLAVIALGLTACTGLATPEGWASPILTDGILLASSDDELVALDAVDLSPQWKFPREEDDVDIDALYGTPAIEGQTAFVPGYDGNLYAVDVEDGSLIWPAPFETDGAIVGGATFDGGTVYLGSADGNVYAVDAETGEQVWEFETDEQVWSTPAVSGGAVYAASLDSNLYVIDAETGEERWSFSTGAGLASAPVVDEGLGLVFLGGFDARLRAIDIESHEERWSIKADNWFWSDPLLAGDVIYAGTLDGRVYALEASTGDELWPAPFETKGPIRAAPVVAQGTLYVVDAEGNLYAVDPGQGTAERPEVALEGDVHADPVVRQDEAGAPELVVVTTGGELVRVDLDTLSVAGRQPLE